jgi:hypothetical protein
MRAKRAGWAVMTVLSLLIVAVAARYLRFDPAVYFEAQRAVYLDRQLALGLHIGGAMLALGLGPFQFVARIRNRWPRIHRVTGRLYLLGCLVGGLGGLALAQTAHGGFVARLGFACLAVAWLATGGIALRMILTGRVADHRRWMIRSFALTFAAVTLRLMLGVNAALVHVDFTTAYVAIAWLCWVPNLLVALWFTRRRPALVAATA